MNKHIYFIFTLLCVSCNQHRESINYFTDVKTILEYDSIYSDKNDEVVGIMSLDKFKNYLISYNRKSDYLFSFYDTKKGVLSEKWGHRGQGPNEFIDVSRISILDYQLVFTDQPKREIIYVPIEHILSKEKNVNIRRYSYPYTADFRPYHVEIINDYKIAIGAFKDSRFGVLDKENNIIQYQSDFPFNYEEISGIFRSVTFQSNIKSNSEQSKFVISTYNSDIFEIYQIMDTGEIVRIYLNPFNHIPKIKPTPGRNSGFSVDRDRSIGGLVNMAVTNDFIFFIYTSETSAKSSSSGHLSNEILCFNWNGEKIRKYILPFPINAITLCVDNEYIYGSKEYENETVIYRFKIV